VAHNVNEETHVPGGFEMKDKFVRKRKLNDRGVSEIFGDILILAITTTLFTAVFLMVWALPAPDDGTQADFRHALDMNGSSAEINVTHSGGETLRGDDTEIYLYKNEDEEIKILNTQGSDEDNPVYGISGDSHWDPGETWTYHFDGLTSNDDLLISIIDTRSNSQVMKSNVLHSGLNAPPVIMERWYAPSPAVNSSTNTISAYVDDYNGMADIDWVRFDASPLNSELGYVVMGDGDGNGIFTADVVITSGPGIYDVEIEAQDVSGARDTARVRLVVSEAEKPIIEMVVIEPNSLKVSSAFVIRAVIVDMNGDLNLSEVEVVPEDEFTEKGGVIDTEFTLEDEIPKGGIFMAQGTAPQDAGDFEITVQAKDDSGFISTKLIHLSVISDSSAGNGSFNDTIWNYLGPESLDFKNFYYTIDNPPEGSSTYHLAVYVDEDHIGNDCYFHVNIINHYYEDVYIDGYSKIRLLQIGGAASNKDIDLVQNGTDFGDSVGTTPDGTWYKIPAPEDGDYFHGGEPVSLVFGPFDMQSAKAGDVFGSILVLTGSYGAESTNPEKRYGQTLPFQAILIA
jgi:FlaG/FlaF family flagellin (archaellin)